MSAASSSRRAAGRAALAAAIAAAIAYFAARIWLKTSDADSTLRTAVAILPVPVFLLFLFAEIRLVRRLDELAQRIQLEALGFAFPTLVVVLMTLRLLEAAGLALSPQDWSYRHVWILALAFYVIGFGLARKRYA